MKQSQAVEIVNTRKQMMKREPSPKHCITNSNNKVMFLGPQKIIYKLQQQNLRTSIKIWSSINNAVTSESSSKLPTHEVL